MIFKIFIFSIIFVLQLEASSKCKTYYNIGTISSEYGISSKTVYNLLKEIEYEWESSVGIDFLEYNNTRGKLINLIYNDDVEQRYILESDLERYEHYSNILTKNYKELQNRTKELNTLTKKYNDDMNSLNIDFENLNTFISQNRNPRKNKFEYIKQNEHILLNRQKKLEKRLKKIKNIQSNIEQDRMLYNDNYNALKDEEKYLNENIKEMTNNEVRGVTEGTIVTKTHYDGFHTTIETYKHMKSINIYRLTNLNELKVTLAHELGHLVGLDHIHSVGSLMHPLLQDNQKEMFQITQEDSNFMFKYLKHNCN